MQIVLRDLGVLNPLFCIAKLLRGGQFRRRFEQGIRDHLKQRLKLEDHTFDASKEHADRARSIMDMFVPTDDESKAECALAGCAGFLWGDIPLNRGILSGSVC